LKPDVKVERELMLMKFLRDRVWKDINNFIDKRDLNLSDRMRALSLKKRDAKESIAKD